ncbi:hypothetical protein BC826DRAFT_1108288 [Russula brevipes]|nr:hypothetical protein BC826DRAFT_1108288 [Russula brevipes]
MGYSQNVISFVESKRRAIQEVASNGPSEIDAQVLEETFDSLGGDDEFEMFFQAIPGFFHSKLVDDVGEHLSDEFRFKSGRLIICLNAARVALGLDGVSQVFSHLFMGAGLKQLRKAITRIISHARNRDHRWLALVRDALGVPDSALRDYITYGDSASFAILIHLLRQLFHSGFQPRDSDVVLGNFLILTYPTLSLRFNIASAPCGMKWFKKHGGTGLGAPPA